MAYIALFMSKHLNNRLESKYAPKQNIPAQTSPWNHQYTIHKAHKINVAIHPLQCKVLERYCKTIGMYIVAL